MPFRTKGNSTKRSPAYRRVLELKPDYAEAAYNLGNALKDQQKLEEAAACWRRAVELKPDHVEAHNNLANALRDQGKLDEAVVCWRRAVELKPHHAAALGSLVHALQHLCCWDGLEALSRRRSRSWIEMPMARRLPMPPFAFLPCR